MDLGDVAITQVFDPGFRDDQHVAQVRISAQDGVESVTPETIRAIEAALQQVEPSITFAAVESVGPKVSGELIKTAIYAVIAALAAISVYIWLRFEWQFAIGAVVTLVLDLTKAIGFLVITGLDFDLVMVAGLLTFLGYSVNDKVVVYDRMRENLRRYKTMPLRDLIDLSINETLNRTIGTSMTTLLACLPLALLASGTTLGGFGWLMVVGIFIGTSSSIFIAAPILLFLGENRLRRDTQVAKPAAASP
jgi:preprotein translocase SecF subunit